MNEHYKRDILLIIKELENEIGKEAMRDLFDSSPNSSGEDKVGCNQFREIANDCRAAECYEEILLLIRYTEAKSKKKNNYEFGSWKTECCGKKTFGQLIISGMEKVCKQCGAETWEEKQEVLQLYFGYLYWQSRVWADAYPGQANSGKNQERSKKYDRG